MLKTCINIDSYSKIDEMLNKLRRSSKEKATFVDVQNNLKIHDSEALENYFTQTHPDMCMTLINLNAFPEDACLCLVARKWNSEKSK